MIKILCTPWETDDHCYPSKTTLVNMDEERETFWNPKKKNPCTNDADYKMICNGHKGWSAHASFILSILKKSWNL